MNENKPQKNTVKPSRAEYLKAYYEANKEKRRAQNKARRELRKDDEDRMKAKAEYQKAYYHANKERMKISEYNKKRYRANKESHRARTVAYQKRRMAEDELFCAKVKLRKAVYDAFRRIKQNKPTNTINLIGCSWEEAKEYFEKKFQPGMSWANHGEWHIDHIVPIASAITLEEVAKLNHISNLQPLWASDNLSKGSTNPHHTFTPSTSYKTPPNHLPHSASHSTPLALT